MEIVSEPDLRSAEEARDYAMELRSIMRAIGASEADMEKGQLRAEANVSVRRAGSTELGVKTELKNINSFRALQRAIDYEVRRQVEELESGRQVVQETRGWSEAEQRTFSQRSKEHAHDYRYFPEPDLPPLELSPGWVEEVRRSLPELPAARRHRLSAEHGLSAYDAGLIGEDASVSGYFEAARAQGMRIRYGIDTHGHNDYLSGLAELAARQHLTVLGLADADLGYHHRTVRDSETIDMGKVTFEVTTPRDTPRSISAWSSTTTRRATPRPCCSQVGRCWWATWPAPTCSAPATTPNAPLKRAATPSRRRS